MQGKQAGVKDPLLAVLGSIDSKGALAALRPGGILILHLSDKTCSTALDLDRQFAGTSHERTNEIFGYSGLVLLYGPSDRKPLTSGLLGPVQIFQEVSR
jgi:hypothetical protein